MKSFKEFINEGVSVGDLKSLEHYLDDVFSPLNIDVDFTNHFMQRVNDARNKIAITYEELKDLFTRTYQKYGAKFRDSDVDWEGVLKDLKTDINIPFRIEWNKKKRELELVVKTTMRKHDFKSQDPILVLNRHK